MEAKNIQNKPKIIPVIRFADPKLRMFFSFRFEDMLIKV